MKRIIIVSLVSILLYSCGSSNKLNCKEKTIINQLITKRIIESNAINFHIYENSIKKEDIKNNKDTLYIYFKNSKHEKSTALRLISPPEMKEKKYYFEFQKPKHFYSFNFITHKNLKGEQIDITIIEKNKSFIRNKKDKILTYCKLQKLSLKNIEAFYWKNHNKVIYLIDKKENKNGKIFLKRVTFNSGYNYEQ